MPPQNNRILRERIEDRLAHLKHLSDNLVVLTTQLINQSVGQPGLVGQVQEATHVLSVANQIGDRSLSCLRRIAPKHPACKGKGKGN